MVSATSWFVFVSLIVAFNITNAQVPYGALGGMGAALESLGPIGAILALESGIPLGGIPFPGGMPFPGGFPGGFPAAFGSTFEQGYPGAFGPGYPGSFDGAYYPGPFPTKTPDNGFYGGYPGHFPGAQPFPTGFEGAGQPTHIHIPVPQDNVQVTESVTVSETTTVPDGYNGFPGGFGGGQYEAALALEPVFLNGYPGFYGPGYPGNFPGDFPGSLGPGFTGPLPPVFPRPIPPNFYGPVPPLYPIPVFPQIPGPVPPKFPGPVPPQFSGPLPGGFPGECSGENPADFQESVPLGFPGPMPGCFPPGPITIIEECNNKGFSKMLPWLLILMYGNNSC